MEVRRPLRLSAFGAVVLQEMERVIEGEEEQSTCVSSLAIDAGSIVAFPFDPTSRGDMARWCCYFRMREAVQALGV